MNVEKGVEVAATDVLKFLTRAEKVTATAGPQVIAGLGTLLGAVGAAILSGQAATGEGGVNIALDAQTVAAVRSVWTDIEAFAKSIGIKI
jgi:hypothetical protein